MGTDNFFGESTKVSETLQSLRTKSSNQIGLQFIVFAHNHPRQALSLLKNILTDAKIKATFLQDYKGLQIIATYSLQMLQLVQESESYQSCSDTQRQAIDSLSVLHVPTGQCCH